MTTEELQWWKRQLDGVSVLELPAERVLPDGAKPDTAAVAFRVSGEAAARLAALVAQQDVSPLDVVVAAFQVVLARYTGQEDVAVTACAPGRDHPVVLRSRVTSSIPFQQFLLEVQATAAAALAHSSIPFDDLAEQLGLRTELTRAAVVWEPSALPFAADVQIRLAARTAELSRGVPVDPARLAQEVAFFAERIDVAEELTRLASHLSQMRALLGSDAPAGRRLEFLVQEVNREVNTVGSKSQHAGIAAQVVELKAELERIREQVANVE